MNFYRHTKNASTWYLSSNINVLNEISASYTYEKRFKIEKFFQDMKSSGFNIENSKIRKYARFKRMLYLSMLAYIFVLILGEQVNRFMGSIKKKLPVFTNVFAAHFKWEKLLYDTNGTKYSHP